MKKLFLISSTLIAVSGLNACSDSQDAQIEQALTSNNSAATPQPVSHSQRDGATQKIEASYGTYTEKKPLLSSNADIAVKKWPKKPQVKQQTQTEDVKTVAQNYRPVPRSPVQDSRRSTGKNTGKATPFNLKRCMNLGNALEAPNEGEWGYRIRTRDFSIIKAAGFDTIRVPIRWDVHTSHRAPYKIEPRFMARIQQVVSNAQSSGLGIIIDVHHYESLMKKPVRQEARFLAIWQQIATTFSNQPSNVYFEVLNEPTLDMSMVQLNALYAKVIPLIRKTNPTRKLIIGGNSWNSVESMSEVNWPNDPNLVATFHDYGPHEFTHQGAEWSTPKLPLGRKWGGRDDKWEIKNTYDIANAFAKKTHLPILVGEFGVIDKVPLAERNQWTKARRKTMEARGYSWCAWDYSGAFKTYDMGREAWYPGTLDAFFGR